MWTRWNIDFQILKNAEAVSNLSLSGLDFGLVFRITGPSASECMMAPIRVFYHKEEVAEVTHFSQFSSSQRRSHLRRASLNI